MGYEDTTLLSILVTHAKAALCHDRARQFSAIVGFPSMRMNIYSKQAETPSCFNRGVELVDEVSSMLKRDVS